MRSRTTSSAACFSATNRTRFLSAMRRAIRFAMVCDFPVPGGQDLHWVRVRQDLSILMAQGENQLSWTLLRHLTHHSGIQQQLGIRDHRLAPGGDVHGRREGFAQPTLVIAELNGDDGAVEIRGPACHCDGANYGNSIVRHRIAHHIQHLEIFESCLGWGLPPARELELRQLHRHSLRYRLHRGVQQDSGPPPKDVNPLRENVRGIRDGLCSDHTEKLSALCTTVRKICDALPRGHRDLVFCLGGLRAQRR